MAIRIADRVVASAGQACGGFKDGDILVLAETAVATAEGNVLHLSDIEPSVQAQVLAEKYRMDPRTVEVVLRESDSVVGGIPGFLLCMKHGTLLPNAGVDASNAPLGCVTPLPKNPDQSALSIKNAIEDRMRSEDWRDYRRQPDACNAARVQRCCNRLCRDHCRYR